MEDNATKDAQAEKPAPHDTVLVIQDIVHRSTLAVTGKLKQEKPAAKEKSLG